MAMMTAMDMGDRGGGEGGEGVDDGRGGDGGGMDRGGEGKSSVSPRDFLPISDSDAMLGGGAGGDGPTPGEMMDELAILRKKYNNLCHFIIELTTDKELLGKQFARAKEELVRRGGKEEGRGAVYGLFCLRSLRHVRALSLRRSLFDSLLTVSSAAVLFSCVFVDLDYSLSRTLSLFLLHTRSLTLLCFPLLSSALLCSPLRSSALLCAPLRSGEDAISLGGREAG